MPKQQAPSDLEASLQGPRYKCTVSYIGRNYFGFQRQKNLATVQGSIEKAIHKLCNHNITIYAAGRTDTGVHATGQVIHFNLPKDYPCANITSALNHFLKNDEIEIIDTSYTEPFFHARMHATSRSYLYKIKQSNGRALFDEHFKFIIKNKLDLVSMQEAANLFIGTHDFSSFRAANCQAKSPIKTLMNFEIYEAVDGEYHFSIQARSFLHNQVRIMVGTLYHVGQGLITPKDVEIIMKAKTRTATPYTAPAHGLYLTKVTYD